MSKFPDFIIKEQEQHRWFILNFFDYNEFASVFIDSDEDSQCQMIQKSGKYKVIQHLNNPSQRLQDLVISFSPAALYNIDNSSEATQEAVISKYPVYIGAIENPSEKMQILALSHPDLANDVFRSIKKPCKKAMEIAINSNPMNLIYIANPTKKLQKMALKQNLENFKYINNPSEESQKKALDYIKTNNTIFYACEEMTLDTSLLIHHERNYCPAFLRKCYNQVSNPLHQDYISTHRNYIASDASLILNQLGVQK